MPDANGHFRGISVNAEAWERIFGRKPAAARVMVDVVDRYGAHKGTGTCLLNTATQQLIPGTFES